MLQLQSFITQHNRLCHCCIQYTHQTAESTPVSAQCVWCRYLSTTRSVGLYGTKSAQYAGACLLFTLKWHLLAVRVSGIYWLQSLRLVVDEQFTVNMTTLWTASDHIYRALEMYGRTPKNMFWEFIMLRYLFVEDYKTSRGHLPLISVCRI